MKDLSVVVYTMKNCPYCQEFKEMLTNEGIEFYDRDIDEHEDEYNIFTEVTKNDMVPAFLIIETKKDQHESYLYAPERDYELLSEAVEIIKYHLKD